MDKVKTKRIYTVLACVGILFTLLSAIEFIPAIMHTLPSIIVLIPAFALAIPIVLTYVFVSSGYMGGAIAGGVAFGAAALLGYTIAPYAAAAFVLLSLAASYMITKAKRFRTSFAAASFAALAGAVLVIVIITASTKMSAVDFAVSYFGEQLSLFDGPQVTIIYGAVRSADLLSGAVTQEAINAASKADAIVKMQRIIGDFLNVSIVYLLILYSMAMGYLTYLIPSAYAKKEGHSVADRHKFKDYALPKRFWIAAVAGFVLSLIGAGMDWRGFDILEVTLYNVFAFVFMIQGLSLIAYFLEERKTGKGLKAVLLIAAAVLLQTAVLPLIGLAENIFGIRKRMQARKAETK